MIGDINYNGVWQDLGCHAPSNVAYAWSCEKKGKENQNLRQRIHNSM